MAEAYEVEVGGQVYEVDADTPQQAATLARLYAAREQGVSQAEAGAMAGSQPPSRQGALSFMPGQRGAPTSVPITSDEDLAELESGKRQGATAAGQAALLTMTAPALIANPMAALSGLGKGVAGGLVGSRLGGEVGGWVGAPEAGRAAGGLAGGLAGPFVTGSGLLRAVGLAGGRGGALGSILERALGAAGTVPRKEAAGAVATAAERAAARQITERKLALAEGKLDAARERNQLLRMKLEGKAPSATSKATPPAAKPSEPPAPSSAGSVAVPATTGIPVPAAPIEAIVLKLQQQMGTASGRKTVRELLSQMPKEQAAEIKALLFKGQAHPATVLGAMFDPTKSAVGRVARPGEELARLLGQIP